MLATVRAATLSGVEGLPVAVEVHVANGLPGFTIVGLPDASCREARDRVRAAIVSSGMDWPMRRITVNLAPSDVRKVGAGLDLPIAVGVLAASDQLPINTIDDLGMVGELGLDGSVRPVPGVLPIMDAIHTARVWWRPPTPPWPASWRENGSGPFGVSASWPTSCAMACRGR